MSDPLWVTLIKAFVLVLVLLGGFAYMTLVERRLLCAFQHRIGPNRVGPFGLLQPIADAIKAIFKEDIIVSAADKVVYVLAPAISITRRSRPKARPPCGGAPNFSASSRKPNLRCASSASMPSRPNTADCMSARWIRTEPPPTSEPFSTMS